MTRKQFDRIIEDTWDTILDQMEWNEEAYKKAKGRFVLEEKLYDYLEKQFSKVIGDLLEE